MKLLSAALDLIRPVLIWFQEFGDHENIIKLLNVIKADNDKDIYLVFEYMGTFLLKIFKVLHRRGIDLSLTLTLEYFIELKAYCTNIVQKLISSFSLNFSKFLKEH